jgi:hypothetical protein
VDNANVGGNPGGDIGSGDIGTGGTNNAAPPGSGGQASGPMQPTSGISLPALGSVPRLLILGGIVLAAVLGWVLRTMGGSLLWGAAACDYGLTTGVPDLRRG